MRAGDVAGLVNLDGFTLSFTREPVEMSLASTVAEFLPSYHPQHAFIDGRCDPVRVDRRAHRQWMPRSKSGGTACSSHTSPL